ncbi:unnamed protein product [Parascedosporium putredinis]|uniref:laccase n=1 Tax=Parascedosporium putredinis TaxID=1442378 RepID=A0A9P1GYL7_9PEZI|nr:unnamed protein product [Parascedosporium putredinis]CAI7990063.1 unnamed protein product [Parascedosporium putredinis]
MQNWGFFKAALSALALSSVALGEPIPAKEGVKVAERQTTVITPGGRACGEHGPENRRCWMNNWTIDKENEIDPPPAFNNREYDLYITNETNWEGPDGVVKHAMLINDWGDYVIVNVHNMLQDNGTSIHWHGIRQIGESNQDGANGVTECPIPPGSSKTYAFHVVQYGNSWYHSHFGSQYGNGIVGAMIVNGPAVENYDIDLGPYVITDYYHETADNLGRKAEISGPPDSQNILFRGKNVHHSDPTKGAYDRLKLTPGKTHRLRLINTSVDNSITVSLVGHTMKIIQADLVATEPTEREHIFLAVGQRYDVIVEANQPVGNYWFNVTLEATNRCGRSDNKFPAAIFSYEGADDTALPTDQGVAFAAACENEKDLVPWLRRNLDPADFEPHEMTVTLEQPVVDFRGKVFRWEINDVDIEIEWDHPILEYIYESDNNWKPKHNIIELPDAEVWTYWIIQNNFILPTPSTCTATISSGWMVIAFFTDNPGAWLLHCHIGWHVSQGFGMQFLERKDEISSLMKLNQMVPNCNAWREYAPTCPWLPMLDSGLKSRRRWLW